MKGLTILHGLPGEGKTYALRTIACDVRESRFFDVDDVCLYDKRAYRQDMVSFFTTYFPMEDDPPTWRPPLEHLFRSSSWRMVNKLSCFLRQVEEGSVVLIDDFLANQHISLQEAAVDWMMNILPEDVEVVITTNSPYIIGGRTNNMVCAKDFNIAWAKAKPRSREEVRELRFKLAKITHPA